uniref:Uncharacterized protein n=1 Tax=Arundo donax TaxID=35708 RepID=A0A0A9FD31_ARUDO
MRYSKYRRVRFILSGTIHDGLLYYLVVSQ